MCYVLIRNNNMAAAQVHELNFMRKRIEFLLQLLTLIVPDMCIYNGGKQLY